MLSSYEEVLGDLGWRKKIINGYYYYMRQFSAVYKKTKDWYVGWVEEISGVNVQGSTLEEAKENLREALTLVLAANRILAKRDAGRSKVVREVVRVK